MSRPLLLPGLTALWRGPRTLQLGLGPRRAVVLDLPNPSAAGLLDLLDGARTEPGVLAAAARRGIGEADARALLDALRRHRLVVGAHTLLPRGLVEPARQRIAAEAAALALGGEGTSTPAQVLRRRGAARVRVAGRSRLGVPIAVALATAGIGHVDPALAGTVEPGELMVGTAAPGEPPRSRSAAAVRAIAQLAPGTRVAPLVRRSDATFVVQVGALPRPAALHALAHRRLAHLAVAVRDGTVLIGPLVPPHGVPGALVPPHGVPGALVPPHGVPCLNCVDLHRADRDPVWPMLAAQLSTPAAAPVAGPSEACATATALAATAYAVAEVLRYLAGETPRTFGATVEISGPGEVRRRSWSPHPRCGCGRLRTSPRAADTGDSPRE